MAPAAHVTRDVGTLNEPATRDLVRGSRVAAGRTLEQALMSASGAPFLASREAIVATPLEPVAVALAVAHNHGVAHGGVSGQSRALPRRG